MCMCVCVRACMYVCMCVCVCVCACAYVRMCVRVYVCIAMYVYRSRFWHEINFNPSQF